MSAQMESWRFPVDTVHAAKTVAAATMKMERLAVAIGAGTPT